MTSPVRLRRVADLYYLIVAVCGGSAHAARLYDYVPHRRCRDPRSRCETWLDLGPAMGPHAQRPKLRLTRLGLPVAVHPYPPITELLVVLPRCRRGFARSAPSGRSRAVHVPVPPDQTRSGHKITPLLTTRCDAHSPHLLLTCSHSDGLTTNSH